MQQDLLDLQDHQVQMVVQVRRDKKVKLVLLDLQALLDQQVPMVVQVRRDKRVR